MEEYQESFKELKAFMMTKDRSIDEDYFIFSLINGLKDEITKMAFLLHPTTLNQTFYMAKMQYSIIESNSKRTRVLSRTYSYGNTSYFSSSKDSNSTEPNQQISTSVASIKPNFVITNKVVIINIEPINRLSYTKIRARRGKGLCYNCNEMFKPGHKCK